MQKAFGIAKQWASEKLGNKDGTDTEVTMAIETLRTTKEAFKRIVKITKSLYEADETFVNRAQDFLENEVKNAKELEG